MSIPLSNPFLTSCGRATAAAEYARSQPEKKAPNTHRIDLIVTRNNQ